MSANTARSAQPLVPPVKNNSIDMFSMPLNVGLANSSIPMMGMPLASTPIATTTSYSKSMAPNKPVSTAAMPAKKVDTFGFVQEALNETKRN
jgi:hypothetical protein